MPDREEMRCKVYGFEKIAEYGVTFVAIMAIVFLGKLFIDGYFRERAAKKDACDPNLIEVVQNNTRVMEQIIVLIQDVKVDLVEQRTKMDELLARVRVGHG